MAEQSSLTVAACGLGVALSAELSRTLVQPTLVGAARAEPIALSRRATSAQALAVVAASCLRQIVQNEGGVRNGGSEAVHQMRVGLRRLRAALSIFSCARQKDRFVGSKTELAWLTEKLAAFRDYDVLLASNRHFEDLMLSACEGVPELVEVLLRRRQDAFAIARGAVTSVRFQRLIVSSTLGLVLRCEISRAGARPAGDLAREVLEHRTSRVLRHLADFGQLGAGERHKLRIQVKKLRYAMDFFATLFRHSKRPRRRFTRALQELQDTLGSLNDTVVQQQIASEIVQSGTSEARASRRIAFAVGRLSEKQLADARTMGARIPELTRRLANAPRFWR